jgi:uncharacterized protein HemX
MKVRIIASLGTILIAVICVLGIVVFDQHQKLAEQAEQFEANEKAVAELNKAIETVKANQIKMTSIDHNMSNLINDLVTQSKVQDQLIAAMNEKVEAQNKVTAKSPDKKSKKMMSINIPTRKK